MADTRTLILVLGMHRSGTSVLTRVLNLLGADVGEDLLEAQQGVNARGFWEHRELVSINEQLLSALGRKWYDFLPLPSQWWSENSISDLEQQAESFLRSAFAADASLAVIKDPRLCLLLPFWEVAAQKAGWNPVVVLATREPGEVSASLCRRDPLTEDSANLLWLRYTSDSEKASRELPRSSADYAALLNDWKAVLRRVGEGLAITWPNDLDETAEAIAEAIDPSLCHQEQQEAESGGGLHDMTAQAYSLLHSGKLEVAALDAVWQDYERLLEDGQVLAESLARTNRRLFAINNEMQILGDDHQRALDVIAEKDGQQEKLAGELAHAHSIIDERDAQIKELSGDLEYARSVVEERDSQLQKLASELEYAVSIVEERDAQLNHAAVKIVRKLFAVDRK